MKKFLAIVVITVAVACNNSGNSSTGTDSNKPKTAQDSGKNIMMNVDSANRGGDSTGK